MTNRQKIKTLIVGFDQFNALSIYRLDIIFQKMKTKRKTIIEREIYLCGIGSAEIAKTGERIGTDAGG